jgi:hypothetical protein
MYALWNGKEQELNTTLKKIEQSLDQIPPQQKRKKTTTKQALEKRNTTPQKNKEIKHLT